MADSDFTIPSLAELKAQVRNDLLTRLTTDEQLRRSDPEVQAIVQAIALKSIYGFIDTLALQLLPDKATGSYLKRHAAWWGVKGKPSAKASGGIVFTTTAGAVIDADLIIADAGGDFVTTSAVTATGTTTTVPVKAVLAGAAGVRPPGAVLSLVSPVAGVKSAGMVDADGVTGGADDELDEPLRSRLEDRIQDPPDGGAAHDYKQWALECAGVTRAWCYPRWVGTGTVGLTFVMDGRPNIIPLAGDVLTVFTYIGDETRKPVTADLRVFAPVPSPLNPVIRITPDTPAVRSAITASLADFISRESEPGGTLTLSRLREAISAAPGEFSHDLLSPMAPVTAGAGVLTTLGTVTWSP
jgi:uncharacterized phage protein gp47/JayE